jgi:hypothetical protein
MQAVLAAKSTEQYHKMVQCLLKVHYPMYPRDREGRMAIVIAIEKNTPPQLFKTLIQYHLQAGFNFTMIPEEESKAVESRSFLEELFDKSKNLRRDILMLQSIGAIKGLNPGQLDRLKANAKSDI